MVGAAVAGDEDERQRTSGNGFDHDEPWRGPRTAPLTVLIVDDEAGVCFSLGLLVRAMHPGCRVEAAPSVTTALAVLEAVQIDAAIVDVRLGLGGDGLALVAQIRRRWPAVRCFVLTAWLDSGVQRRAASLGVSLHEKVGDGVRQLVAALAG